MFLNLNVLFVSTTPKFGHRSVVVALSHDLGHLPNQVAGASDARGYNEVRNVLSTSAGPSHIPGSYFPFLLLFYTYCSAMAAPHDQTTFNVEATSKPVAFPPMTMQQEGKRPLAHPRTRMPRLTRGAF